MLVAVVDRYGVAFEAELPAPSVGADAWRLYEQAARPAEIGRLLGRPAATVRRQLYEAAGDLTVEAARHGWQILPE